MTGFITPSDGVVSVSTSLNLRIYVLTSLMLSSSRYNDSITATSWKCGGYGKKHGVIEGVQYNSLRKKITVGHSAYSSCGSEATTDVMHCAEHAFIVGGMHS